MLHLRMNGSPFGVRVCVHSGHEIEIIHVWPTGLYSLHLPQWQSMISCFILVNGNHSASLLCFYEPLFSHKRPTIFQDICVKGKALEGLIR